MHDKDTCTCCTLSLMFLYMDPVLKGCGAVTNESHEIMSCWASRNLIFGWLKKTALWGIWSFAKTAAASEPFLAVGLGRNFGDSWGFGRWQDSSLVSSRFCSGFMLGTGAQRHGSWEVSPSSLAKTFGPTWCRGQGECLQRTGLLVLVLGHLGRDM